ncbi:deoxyribose-phosphate aldolase [Candidatus Riflebacteria bacterium]
MKGVEWDHSLARFIDHTLLKPEATARDIEKLCAAAKKYNFASVCVNPHYVSLSASLLKDSEVLVCTVIGFPLGATSTITKIAETRDAIANGAREIDMVINVGALKEGDFDTVYKDILGVRDASRGYTLKVILETALLTNEEKVKACELVKKAGADFVKTSTGFSSGGATIDDILLMRQTVGPQMGVKASGGIRDSKIARDMIEAGATRLGASASIAIVTGQDAGKGKY